MFLNYLLTTKKAAIFLVGFLGLLAFHTLSAQVDLGPDYDICSGSTTVLDAGPGFLGYSWSTGDNSQTITVGPGSYTVVILLPGNETAEDEITIGELEAPMLDLGEDRILCPEESATLLDAGSHASYAWSTGLNTPSILVGPGTYSVTVTNTEGCTASDQIIIDTSTIELDLGPDLEICAGVDTILDAGMGAESYLWSTGAVSPTITVNASGNYGLTITDANGCEATDEILVTETALVLDLGEPINLCSGNSTLLDAGPGFDAYTWSTGETTPSISVNSAGTYSVTVVDAACIATDSVAVSLDNLSVNLGPPSLVLCSGTEQLLDAGPGFDTYLWSTGATSPSISVGSPGNYGVTVTQGICSASDQITLAESTINVDLGEDQIICAGESLTLDIGSGFLAYLWSTGENSPSITVSEAGFYSVTVSDNDCIMSDTIVIMVNGIALDLGEDFSICAGSSAMLNAGTGFQSYLWSTGQTSSQIEINAAGTYSVTVTSEGNCTATDEISIEEINATIDLGEDIVICDGGTALLDAGAGYASYLWLPSGNTSQQIEVEPGTYTLIVSDSNGCEAMDVIEVLDGSFSIDIGDNLLLCAGESATLDGGSGFVSYLWSTGETSSSITVNSTGLYGLTVTAANGCTASDQLIITVDASTVALGEDLSICDGNSVTLDAGATFTSYLWSTGETSQSITINTTGLYSVTVSNANGCSSTDEVELLVGEIDLDLGNDRSICEGSSTLLEIAEGFETYSWSTGASTNAITVESAGTYSVTVIDGICEASDTISISVGEIMVDLGEDQLLCSGDVATLDAGSGYSTYLWSTGENISEIMVTESGTYSVTIIDGDCEASDEVQIEVQDIFLDLGDDISTCDTSLVLNAGEGFAGYLWSSGANSSQITVTESGTYSITVVNNGCDASDEIQVTFETVSLDLGGTISTCDSSLTLNAGSGLGDYLWSTGEMSSEIQVALSGTYSVTVSNGQCSAEDEVLVTIGTIELDLGEDLVICDDASVLLEADSDYADYLWSTGDTTAQILIEASGTYALTVTDTTGCAGSDDISVAISDIALDLGEDLTLCSGSTAILDAGEGFAAYFWSTGEASSQISISTGGTYALTIEDEFGCTDIDTVQVGLATSSFSPNFLVTSFVCPGDTIQFVEVSDVVPDSFLWDFGDGNSSTAQHPTHSYEEAGEYMVRLLVSFGDCTNQLVEKPVQVEPCRPEEPESEEDSFISFIVYPNPVADFLNYEIQFTTAQQASLSVYDRAGRQVLERSLVEELEVEDLLDLRQLDAGIYFVQLRLWEASDSGKSAGVLRSCLDFILPFR